MIRPFISSLGMSTRAGGGLRGVAGRVAVQAGQRDRAGLLLAGLGQLTLVPQQDRAGLLLQLRLQHRHQPPRGLFGRQAADLVEGLPLKVQELRQLLLAVADFLDFLGQLPLRALDDLLLLAKLLGLLFQTVLAFVELALALVHLLAKNAEISLAFGLLLDGLLFDLQLDHPPAVLHLLLGAADDLPGVGLGIPAAEMAQEFYEAEGHRRGQKGRHDDRYHGRLRAHG
jgi:hypothetical protein